MAPDWNAVRELFPAAGRSYLDTATYGPPPSPVLAAVEEALRAASEGRGRWLDWEAEGERARELFAALLGADPATIALLPTVSVAAAQVAASLEARPGANVVVGEGEFRSNLFPWLELRTRGVEVRTVPFVDGAIPAGRLVEGMDADTALVATSHVQSASGYRIHLGPLAEACHRHGAQLFVDATQSVGALRFPLEMADFVAVAGYKWLLTPRGGAFLYVAPRHAGRLRPLAPGWKTPADPYAGYYGPPYDPAPRASRLDVALAWHIWVGAARALELIQSLGVPAIEERDLALARDLRARLRTIGLEPSFSEAESSTITGLRIPDPDRVRTALAEAGVTAAVRGDYLRLSTHFFNDEDDLARAVGALGKACAS